MPKFVNMTSSSNFFNVLVFPLSSFFSKFHFNISTGSGVMTIFVCKGLIRNQEIGNSCVWILPYNWGQGWARASKFDTNISNKMLLSPTKCHGYSFYRFLVIKGKPTMGQNYCSTRRLGLINFSKWEAKSSKKFYCF